MNIRTLVTAVSAATIALLTACTAVPIGGGQQPAPAASATASRSFTCFRKHGNGTEEKKVVGSQQECVDFIAGTSSAATTATGTATTSAGASRCQRTWSDGKVETRLGYTRAECDLFRAGKRD